MTRHVHRFFVAGAHDQGDEVALSPVDRHHAQRVLRLRAGAGVEVADDAGRVYAAALTEGGQLVLGRLLHEGGQRDAPEVWIALAGSRADLAVEKLTELGVGAIGALRAANGKGEPRLERWARVAESASRQSKRALRPQLLGPAAFADVVRGPGVIVLDHDADDAIAFAAGPRCAVLVGPEPGWSEGERALARAADVPLARLGTDTVLRSETAAVAAAALALFGQGSAP